MRKINTEEVRMKAVALMGNLRELSNGYVIYSNKVAEIEGHVEHTRDYKDTQIAEEKERLDAKVRLVFDRMYKAIDEMAEVLNTNDRTYDFSDPEFSSCLALMSASEKPLPGETIIGIAEKFLGNRQALLALKEIAKGNNKQSIEERIFSSDIVMAALKDKVEDLDLSFPKTVLMIPDIRKDILSLVGLCGQELTDQEADCGADYQEIINLQMRAAMGLPNT